MTYQVPPCRPPVQGAAKAPRLPFVPVELVPPTNRRKRPHWAVRAMRVVVKAMFFCFCVFVGFVIFCVAFHHFTRWS